MCDLVVDNESQHSAERVYLLDPFTVTYGEVPYARFGTLIGRALPQGELHTFLDDTAYRQWLTDNGVDRLDRRDVLGVKVPEALGGELVADSLQLEDIVSCYETTGPIYAKAFATLP